MSGEEKKIKLYTKTGDKGKTNLYDMTRLEKCETVFEAVGDLDELSANIGVLCTYVGDLEMNGYLRVIQSKLLDIGSDIATVKNRKNIVGIKDEDIKAIEEIIDVLCAELPPLKEFILPGYMSGDAYAHVCRTICRRAERHMWKTRREWEEMYGNFYAEHNDFIYVNRLSDFFFALGRMLAGGSEITRKAVKGKSSFVVEKKL